jgi:NADH:ubiquinone reductase (H+-translocating)
MSDKAAADDTTITSRQTSGPTETLEQADAPEAAEHRSGVKRQDDTLHHIVVVGGGAAGLELATGLGDKLGKRKRADITLIERARTHLWKPLLHEVAAGSMNVDNHALDYLAQAHWHHFRYRYGEMIGLDRAKREVCLAATFDDEGNEITPVRTFQYDTLVMAVGSTSNDFGTPGVKEFAIPLDTLRQAERFNKRLVNACIRAHAQPEPVRPGQLHVAIIGAGATGTELAAQLHRTTRQIAAFGLDRIDPEKDFRITLIEGADRILPALPERISKATEKLLTDLGVVVRAKAKVTEVRKDGIALADGGFIPAELVVWAAGVKGPEFLRNLDGLEVNRSNQLLVKPTLETTLDPNIFAMGDCASCPREGSNAPVPPRAQAAHQQASHLLKQLRNRLEGKPLKPFVYRDFGSLVSLGEYSTVGNLMGKLVGGNMMIEGYFARIMYMSLYKMHLMALHGSAKVALETVARSLTHWTEPSVKLH